jgi:hypothetical protein
MATRNQVYDAEGTTHFSFTLTTNEEGMIQQWMLHFAQGFISIYCPSTGLHIRINFPNEEHWKSEYKVPVLRDGAVQRSIIMKASTFVLQANVKEYMDPQSIQHQATLDLSSGSMATTVHIPYKVALAIMKFALGSTDIDEAKYVTKSSRHLDVPKLNILR